MFQNRCSRLAAVLRRRGYRRPYRYSTRHSRIGRWRYFKPDCSGVGRCVVGGHSSGRNDGRGKVTRDSSKARPGHTHGGLSVRFGLSGQARPGARSRVRMGAASLAAGVVLLGLVGCGGSGPAAGSTARPSATSAVTGRSPAGSASASAATTAQQVAVPEPAHTVVVVMEMPGCAPTSARTRTGRCGMTAC